jgi:hypothetical protein
LLSLGCGIRVLDGINELKRITRLQSQR